MTAKKGSEQRPEQQYAVRLELRDETGAIVGEVSARFSRDVLAGLVRQATQRDAAREPRAPKPFRGRDDNPTVARGDERAMSTEQRKFLFRLAYRLGFRSKEAEHKLLRALDTERLDWATRSMASRAIDALEEELEHSGSEGANGSGPDRSAGSSNGVSHG